MTRRFGAALMVLCVFGLCGFSRAADPKDAIAIVDKAIQAVGGEDKLNKITILSWKSTGTLSINGNDTPVSTQTFMQGLDHSRQEFQSEFNGQTFKGVTAFAVDKGWRDFGGNHMDMDKDAIANEKRTLYLSLIPVTLVPLKGKDFKLDTMPDVTVEGKMLAGIKVTAPDGKDFTLFFDKDSNLPVKMVAKVLGFDGQEFTQETLFSDYKDMAGIKKATKVVSKRNGEKFIEQQVTDFQVLDKIEPKTFTDL
jgi:hypothetical protein